MILALISSNRVAVLLEQLAHRLLALAQAVFVVGVPGAGLVDDLIQDPELDDVALLGKALAVVQVDLDFLEGRGHLVLDDLDAHAAADDVGAFLDGHGALDLDAHGGVELQRPAAGGDFGVADEHADLLAQLVEEDESGLGARDDGRQLAQRLAHQPRLQPHVAVAHVALQLGLGHQRRHAVHDDDVDAARAHQDLGDLQRLFAPVGLGDVQLVDVHARVSGRRAGRGRARRR